MSLARSCIIVALLMGLTGWGTLLYWVQKSGPWHRVILASKLGGHVGTKGGVALVGDSVIRAVQAPCRGYLNFAIPGMAAREVPQDLVAEIAKHSPKIIVLLMGINDLRNGDSPNTAAFSIVSLAQKLQEASPAAKVVVLTPLPITVSKISWAANNKAVREAAFLVLSELRTASIRVLDISELFGKEQLDANLTDDGLHLNATGAQRLSALIDGVVVASGGEGCE